MSLSRFHAALHATARRHFVLDSPSMLCGFDVAVSLLAESVMTEQPQTVCADSGCC